MQNVESGELLTSESHHFGLFRFGFLHWDVDIFIVCTHVVGQPGKCHCVSWESKGKTKSNTHFVESPQISHKMCIRFLSHPGFYQKYNCCPCGERVGNNLLFKTQRKTERNKMEWKLTCSLVFWAVLLKMFY